MSLIQPCLDYLAPEYVVGGRCDCYADIFSLGCLSVAIFNKCRPLFENHNTLETFKKNAEKVTAVLDFFFGCFYLIFSIVLCCYQPKVFVIYKTFFQKDRCGSVDT